VFYRALVPTTSHGWRSLFWFGAGPPVLLIAWRLYLPETNHFQVIKAEREARHSAKYAESNDGKKPGPLKAFLSEANSAFRENWFLFVYMVVLMSGMNSVSHGSQDLYPTFLKDQVGFGDTLTTVTTVVGQLGALVGSTTIGYFSSFAGRRLSMMVACLFGGAIVPAYMLLRTDKLIASTFFEQFFVGGVWGPM
jgi:MFS transporter, SHS family, lactate transporter